jgi:hypothetical protein
MVTRLELLPREKGPRRLVARLGGTGAATAAPGFVRVWRPTTTIEDDEDGDGSDGEVACWCCSSSRGRILALYSRGDREKRRLLFLLRRVSLREEKKRKKSDWFRQ